MPPHQVLEGQRQYDEATLMLRLLLDFSLYKPRKRGYFWNRMALDLEHMVPPPATAPCTDGNTSTPGLAPLRQPLPVALMLYPPACGLPTCHLP